MIKKLKLRPLGLMCLMLMCILGLSLNAQSSSQQNSNSADIEKLMELNNQEQELLKSPLTDESAALLEKINLKKQKLQSKVRLSKEAKLLTNHEKSEKTYSHLKAQQKRVPQKKMRKKVQPLIINK